jgi:hypothetical protein
MQVIDFAIKKASNQGSLQGCWLFIYKKDPRRGLFVGDLFPLKKNSSVA